MIRGNDLMLGAIKLSMLFLTVPLVLGFYLQVWAAFGLSLALMVFLLSILPWFGG